MEQLDTALCNLIELALTPFWPTMPLQFEAVIFLEKLACRVCPQRIPVCRGVRSV
jgi:hypothetical protein